MIYTKHLKQRLHYAKVIDWYMKYTVRKHPTANGKYIYVWWEYNVSVNGCYDLFHFVGKCLPSGLDFNTRVVGGVETLAAKLVVIDVFKRAYKLETQLQKQYPDYQLMSDTRKIKL